MLAFTKGPKILDNKMGGRNSGSNSNMLRVLP